MQKGKPKRTLRKPQRQARPGRESRMVPAPVYDYPERSGSGRLAGKVALITGGDSGIGRAVAVLFAKEGADIAIVYLNEHGDARDTAEIVESRYHRSCLLLPGDIRNEKFCAQAIKKTVDRYSTLDVLVNNAAAQYEQQSIEDITAAQLEKTFSANLYSMFYLTRSALKHMGDGGCIINTTSVTAYRGSAGLIDYASSKGAIVSFTRSLAASLVDKGIRVNAVAPGPVWTPLIPSSFKAKKTARHGSDSPMGRAGEPAEIAPSYLFLACSDSSFMTGQVLHPNGGEIING